MIYSISNLLMHRDFSSGYVPKLVIERDKITTENANLAHGHGNLNLKTFRPFAKNPPIAKVFREIGLADELGSGMRNSYKYTKLYSGGEPVFTEAEVFPIVIPLSEAATATVGSTTQDTHLVALKIPIKLPSRYPSSCPQDTHQVAPQDLDQRLVKLTDFCSTPRSKREMMDYLGLTDSKNFREISCSFA